MTAPEAIVKKLSSGGGSVSATKKNEKKKSTLQGFYRKWAVLCLSYPAASRKSSNGPKAGKKGI